MARVYCKDLDETLQIMIMSDQPMIFRDKICVHLYA